MRNPEYRAPRAPWLGFLLAALTGASVMYMMDPRLGRRRRAVARDKTIHLGKVARRAARRRARDLSNRARGWVAETRSAAGFRMKRAA
jgi:hypothetical protein